MVGRALEAETAALDAQAEVAPHIQDDFDLQEGQLAEVELQDRQENLVRTMPFACIARAPGSKLR